MKCRWLICWDVIVDRDKYFLVRRYRSQLASVYLRARETRLFSFFPFRSCDVWWHTHWTACRMARLFAAPIGDSIPAICLYLLNARFSVFTPLCRTLIEHLPNLSVWFDWMLDQNGISKINMRRVSSKKQFCVSVLGRRVILIPFAEQFRLFSRVLFYFIYFGFALAFVWSEKTGTRYVLRSYVCNIIIYRRNMCRT